MKKISIKQLILAGAFIGIGIILPMLFHSIGAGGPIFLPMHIPVLIAGCFLSVPYAVAVGILTPLLSAVLTGMPPMFPVLPFMIVELVTYGVVGSLLYRKFHMNIYSSLIISMLCGRIMAGATVWVLATFFMAKLPTPMLFIKGAVMTGIPGIVIQLIFIPVVVMAVTKYKAAN